MKHSKSQNLFDALTGIGKRIILSFGLVLYVSFSASAQEGSLTVKGKVSGEDGEPLVGVFVKVEGTKTATSTDIDGNYSIKAGKNQTLSFSYLGFKDQQISIQGRASIDVVMLMDRSSLDEAVVVGYGVQKRRDIVGAIENISTDEIAEKTGSSMNISRALQGTIPGLSLTFTDGKPNRNATVRIRGTVNSIGSGGSALVLVDGVEADMNTVNPDDIASVTVLKDAASTAVYGSRGTFGVILLTTKAPQKGEAKINYNGAYNIYSRTVVPEMDTNGYHWTSEFLESYINAKGNDPANINNVFPFKRAWYEELTKREKDPSFEKWRVNNGTGLYEYFGNTDWYKVFYKDYTTGQQHNISVSGGNDAATYYVSGRYFTQDGIYNSGNEKYDQFNIRTKGSVKVRPWLKMESSLDYGYRKSHQPTAQTGNSVTPVNINRMINHQGFPMTLVTNPDGTWTEAAVYTGWAGFVEGLSWRKDYLYEMKNLNTLTVDIVKDVLVAKANYAYYFANRNRVQTISPYTFYRGPEVSGIRPSASFYVEHPWTKQRHTADATLTYTPKLGENNFLSIMAGWNIESLKLKSDRYYREGLIVPGRVNWNLMNGEEMKLTDNGSYESALNGYFFRVDYNYKSRYLIEISGRYDGNSRFPSNQRWGFFPAASAGWRISEEPFMKNVAWIDNLKIRGSAGSSGNGLISNAYAYQSTMHIKTSSVLSNGQPLSYTQAPAPIPDGLTWEKAVTYDLGLDFEALNGRLNFTGDIYRKHVLDMYVPGEELPAVFGNSAPKGNYANLKTDGWEVSLSWRNTHKIGGKPFSYNIKGTLYDAMSTVTKYTSTNKLLPTIYNTRYYTGMTIGEIWGFECDGLFQTDAEAQAYADMSEFKHDTWTPKAGDPRFLDLNKDGAVNDGDVTLANHGDLRKIGNMTPRYNFSINLGANWNGIGISMMWLGVGHRDWYPAKESGYFWGKYGRPYSIGLPWHSSRWSEENPDAYWPRLVGYSASSTAAQLSRPNTRYLQNAAFLRLKNLTLEYTLPEAWTKQIMFKKIKLYFTGENLLTFTPLSKYAKNYDPEGLWAGDNDYDSSSGKDNYGDGDGWPVMKCYTFGLNIAF